MKVVTLKINDFEGPLDLLLHLIAKNKMDICNIDIINIVEQYIIVINENKEFNIEIASEFIEMASKLLYLKSAVLLPKKQDTEDLKRELVGQLIEYKLCKKIANILRSDLSGFNRFVRQEMKINVETVYKYTHEVSELLKAYHLMLDSIIKKMPPQKTEFNTLIKTNYVSVESKVFYLLKSLRKYKDVELERVLNSSDKSNNVATFLAILELIKSKRIVIDDYGQYISLKESV